MVQVGLVTSVTYLTVAYTLPSAFCLKLLCHKQPRWENVLQVTQQPVSISPQSIVMLHVCRDNP